MTFRLSKCASRKARSSKHVPTTKLLEQAKALLPVHTTRRRNRLSVPIPSFSPIETNNSDGGRDGKVDLSILDTPPDKNEQRMQEHIEHLSSSKDVRSVQMKAWIGERRRGHTTSTVTTITTTTMESYTSTKIDTNETESITDINEPQRSSEPPTITIPIKHIPVSDTKFTTKRVCSKQIPQPDQSSLIRSVDILYEKVGIDSVTLKDIREAMEAEYGVKLSKANRILIKDRLSDIINGNLVQPKLCQASASLSVVTMNAPDIEGTIERQNNGPSAAAALISSKLQEHNAGHSRGLATSRSMERKEISLKTKSQSPTHKDNYESEQIHRPPSTLQPHELITPSAHVAASTKEKGPNNQPIAFHTVESVHDVVDEDDGDIPGPALQKYPKKVLPLKRQFRTTRNTKTLPTEILPPPRVSRKRARDGACVLCTTCSCRGIKTGENSSPSFRLSTNDMEIEKAMIRRVKKLEKTCDKNEADLDQVNRELRRHRKLMMKKEEMRLNQRKQQRIGDSHFLPDADDWDQHLEHIKQTRVNRELVLQAKRNLFAYHPKYQPTLTQLVGVRSNKSGRELDEHNQENVDVASSESQIESEDDGGTFKREHIVESCSDVENDCPVDRVHRLQCHEPASQTTTQSPLLSRAGGGYWNALKPMLSSRTRHEKYRCAWDRIFVEEDLSEQGVEELLNLFDNEVKKRLPSALSQELPLVLDELSTAVEMSMLSQTSQQIAKSIESKIISDTKRIVEIELLCPHWRENVRFALHNKNDDAVAAALDHVRLSRARMDSMKEKLLATWSRQEIVLELFDLSLSASLKRLNEKETSAPVISQGFIPVQPETTINAECPLSGGTNLRLSPICEASHENSSNGYATPN